jgi:hypothetical protein
MARWTTQRAIFFESKAEGRSIEEQLKKAKSLVVVQFALNEYERRIHHRDTEGTEDAQRLELNSTLCAPSVCSVSAVVNLTIPLTQD